MFKRIAIHPFYSSMKKEEGIHVFDIDEEFKKYLLAHLYTTNHWQITTKSLYNV